jgi:hypothetical protein
MMEKLAQDDEGGGCTLPPFTIVTISYKVAVFAPVERADTRDRYSTLPLFYLYQYMYSVGGALPPMTYPLVILYFIHSYQLISSYYIFLAFYTLHNSVLYNITSKKLLEIADHHLIFSSALIMSTSTLYMQIWNVPKDAS